MKARVGLRFAVIDPALFEQLQHWSNKKMKDEGWESTQLSSVDFSALAALSNAPAQVEASPAERLLPDLRS